LRTDSGRLQRLAGNERNQNKLMQIIQDGGIFGNIVQSFSQNELENEKYFTSLLFYLGMLTVGGVVEGQTFLKIPNYSIKTLSKFSANIFENVIMTANKYFENF
jgi:hypothetical protein